MSPQERGADGPPRKPAAGMPHDQAGKAPPASGPAPGESASAWAEGAQSEHAPHDYTAQDEVAQGCLFFALIVAIVGFALIAIGLSGGVELIGAAEGIQ